jgi:HK97 family phage portal protein
MSKWNGYSVFKKHLGSIFRGKKEEKSYSGGPGESLYLGFLLNGWSTLSAYMAIQYYMQCSVLADGIDTLSNEIKNQPPLLFNKKTKEYKYEHPLLDLLKFPNADVTFQELIERFIIFYKVCGNAYMIATGPVEKPPKELFVPPSQCMTVTPGHDGFTSIIEINSQYASTAFLRQEVNGRFKFYDRERNREIYHTREFNPYYAINQNYGISKLAAIYYEVEQFIQSSRHNLSLLTTGTKTTGAFMSETNLTETQYSRLQEQMNAKYKGASSAGRSFILEGGMKFQEMGITARDMDFDKLYIRTRDGIYNRLKIPLAMVTTENMKYENLEKAIWMLYDNAVIPLMRTIYREMSDFLIHRYKDLKGWELTINLDDVTALQSRRIAEMKVLREIGCYTVNELRAIKGDEPLEGGDVLLGASNQIQIAKETGAESFVNPVTDKPDPGEKLNSSRNKFVELMRERLDNIGEKKYSLEEIEKIADGYGLKH